MSYTELTVWTRGIIMDKEGRDIVNSVAASARNEASSRSRWKTTLTIPTGPTPRRASTAA